MTCHFSGTTVVMIDAIKGSSA